MGAQGHGTEILEQVTAELESAAGVLAAHRDEAERDGDGELASLLLGIERALRLHADEARRVISERVEARRHSTVGEASRESFPASDPPAY